MKTIRRSILAAGLFLLFSVAAAGEDWPQWGGPDRDFHVPAAAETSTAGLAPWGEKGPRQLWSRALGPGLAAVVATGDSLFTTYRDGDEEVVVALRASDGDIEWQFRYPAPLHHAYAKSFHEGPSSTPAVLDGVVVAVGFTGLVHGLDADTGELVWSHDLVRDFDAKRLRFGHAASPLIYQNLVIIPAGGEKTGLVALEARDGTVAWRGAAHHVSYASPILAETEDGDQFIVLSAEEILGVSARDGAVLWRHPCRNGFANNASDPIWGRDGRLWVASLPGCGGRVLEIGERDGAPAVETLWSDGELTLHYWNALRLGDTVYASIGPEGLDFAAVDVESGRILWRENGRFEKARPLAAGGNLVLLDESGRLALVRASPRRFELLAEHELLEGGTKTVPTLVGTTLYVRDASRLVAFDLGRPIPEQGAAASQATDPGLE